MAVMFEDLLRHLNEARVSEGWFQPARYDRDEMKYLLNLLNQNSDNYDRFDDVWDTVKEKFDDPTTVRQMLGQLIWDAIGALSVEDLSELYEKSKPEVDRHGEMSVVLERASFFDLREVTLAFLGTTKKGRNEEPRVVQEAFEDQFEPISADDRVEVRRNKWKSFQKSLSDEDAEQYVLKKLEKQGAFQNSDGTWSCKKELGLTGMGGKKIARLPVQFKEIGGNFYINGNNLETLEGCPQIIHGSFFCSGNKLTSLKGGPEIVHGGYLVGSNRLTSLEGAPRSVGGYFRCEKNKLTTLEGAPMSCDKLFCEENPVSIEDLRNTVDRDYPIIGVDSHGEIIGGEFYDIDKDDF